MKASTIAKGQAKNALLCDQLTKDLKRTCNWFTRLMNSRYNRHGITSQQYQVLVLLKEMTPAPLSLKFLKENCIEKKSDVSRIVDKLFQKKLVQRNECLLDRRIAEITITEEGIKLIDRIRALNEINRLPINLSISEARLLRELLAKLTLMQ